MIPNIITGIRFLLIPAFVYEYMFAENFRAAFIILALSALTDFLDGFIARRFNMITKWGTVFDPLADKLTQITVCFCIAKHGIKLMWIPFFVLVIKELMFIGGGTFLFKNKDVVIKAKWYGKVATTLYYIFFAALIVFGDKLARYPSVIIGMIIVVLSFSLLSFISYGLKFLKLNKTFLK